MRFDLNEQQRAFQEEVSRLLAAECPLSRALAVHEGGPPDMGLWRQLMELGIGGICVPESYGGMALGLLNLAILAEPLGRAAAPGPFLEHALATLALVEGGSDEQKARWLPVLATGECRATIALSERKGAWTPESWTLDGADTLTGQKRYVLHAEGADLIIVGLHGGRLGLVEAGAPGLVLTPVLSVDPGRRTSHLRFDGTPFEPLAHPVGHRVVDAGLILLAADAFGGASQAVDMSVAYSKERVQFGKPIGRFQAVKHQLADMAITVAPAVGLYWYAAHMFDKDPSAAPISAALAKAHITEFYPKITRRMIESHGGIGYTWEFGAHVWLKRALFDQAYLGMPDAHRIRIADLAGW